MSGRRRDFSQKALGELRTIMKVNLEDENQNFIFDWLNDVSYMKELNMKEYLDNVKDYHAQMMDKHDLDCEKFDRILENVQTVDNNYAGRLCNVKERMVAFKNRLANLSAMITPSVITVNQGELQEIADAIRKNYAKISTQTSRSIEGYEEAMPALFDVEWYEKIANGAGGVADIVARDFAEVTAISGTALLDGMANASEGATVAFAVGSNIKQGGNEEWKYVKFY